MTAPVRGRADRLPEPVVCGPRREFPLTALEQQPGTRERRVVGGGGHIRDGDAPHPRPVRRERTGRRVLQHHTVPGIGTEPVRRLQEHIRLGLAVCHLLGGHERGQQRIEPGTGQHRLDRGPGRTGCHRHRMPGRRQPLHEGTHLGEDRGVRPRQLQIGAVLALQQLLDRRVDTELPAEDLQRLAGADADEAGVVLPAEVRHAVPGQQSAPGLVVVGLTVDQRAVEIEDHRSGWGGCGRGVGEVLIPTRMPSGASSRPGGGAHRLDQRQHPVRHPLAQRHFRTGADHARQADQLLDHILQMRRVPCHHPGQQISATGRRERLDDLRDLRQRVGHLLQMPLGDLDVDEGEHGVAEPRGDSRGL